MQIIIDPRFQINYSSYYIQGFIDEIGEHSIQFGILEDICVSCLDDYRKGIAILLIQNNISKRLFIDTWDADSVHQDYYIWCDLYAKINVRQEDNKLNKLLVIGPSFGIQLWNPVATMKRACVNYWKARQVKGFLPSIKDYLLNYAYTFVRRLPLAQYTRPYQECDEYIFSLSTLWYDERTYETTNRYRGRFARICQKEFAQFDGGFFFIPNSNIISQFPKYKEYTEEYKDILSTRRIGMKEYLSKMRKSALAFNVPSVSGCHGWKLGENLALGKAIVSMPLNNMMPEGWENGVTHIDVSSEAEIESAVKRLHEDVRLRYQLKEGASFYFNQHLAPQKVIQTLIRVLFADETDGNRACL